jgi:hypothetical protein
VADHDFMFAGLRGEVRHGDHPEVVVSQRKSAEEL